MEQCLQDQRYRDDFSERCRRAVEARMERESADYQLNFGLRWGLLLGLVAGACCWGLLLGLVLPVS